MSVIRLLRASVTRMNQIRQILTTCWHWRDNGALGTEIAPELTGHGLPLASVRLEAVRCFELSDQAGLTLGALDRPLAEPEHIAGILVAGSLAQRASEQLRQGHN